MIANKRIQVLTPPDRGGRSEPRPGWTGGRYSWMRAVLASEHGKQLYRKRIQMIEPVFAHTKHNRLITRSTEEAGRCAHRMAATWQPTTSPNSTTTNSPPPEPEPTAATVDTVKGDHVNPITSSGRRVSRQRPAGASHLWE